MVYHFLFCLGHIAVIPTSDCNLNIFYEPNHTMADAMLFANKHSLEQHYQVCLWVEWEGVF